MEEEEAEDERGEEEAEEEMEEVTGRGRKGGRRSRG